MNNICLLILAALLAGCGLNPADKLKQDIEKELQQTEGKFAVAFVDLTTDTRIYLNAHENFHAASTMKTPVMVEVFKQAAEGKLSMNDSLLVKNEFRSIVDNSAFSLRVQDDSEPELYRQLGKKKSIYQLVYDMIIASSNLATNLVIEKVDAQNVTTTMRMLGLENIQVLRGVEDGKAFEQGLNNTVTAYDLALLYEKMAREELVSPEASRQMIKVLMDQRFKEIIPARLPAEVKVAHKTGSITGVRHDSGIVFLPDGRKYVLVLLSKEMPDEEKGTAAMASISEMVYKHVEKGD